MDIDYEALKGIIDHRYGHIPEMHKLALAGAARKASVIVGNVLAPTKADLADLKLRHPATKPLEPRVVSHGTQRTGRNTPSDHYVRMVIETPGPNGLVECEAWLGKRSKTQVGMREVVRAFEDAVPVRGGRQADVLARLHGPEWEAVPASEVRGQEADRWQRLTPSDIGRDMGLI